MHHRAKPLSGSRYLQYIGAALLFCVLASAFIVFFKGQPSAVVAMLAKSGFTAAFTLIFVSEIGDKVFNSSQLTLFSLLTCLYLVYDRDNPSPDLVDRLVM
jgi:putative Ca2+/H+ antiporter (TMEM165/GDT1 family)